MHMRIQQILILIVLIIIASCHNQEVENNIYPSVKIHPSSYTSKNLHNIEIFALDSSDTINGFYFVGYEYGPKIYKYDLDKSLVIDSFELPIASNSLICDITFKDGIFYLIDNSTSSICILDINKERRVKCFKNPDGLYFGNSIEVIGDNLFAFTYDYTILNTKEQVASYYKKPFCGKIKLDDTALVLESIFGEFPENYQNLKYYMRGILPSMTKDRGNIYMSFSYTNHLDVFDSLGGYKNKLYLGDKHFRMPADYDLQKINSSSYAFAYGNLNDYYLAITNNVWKNELYRVMLIGNDKLSKKQFDYSWKLLILNLNTQKIVKVTFSNLYFYYHRVCPTKNGFVVTKLHNRTNDKKVELQFYEFKY
jgi:hypothetical protein